MLRLKPEKLKPGMIIARDIKTKKGQSVAKTGDVLTEQMIARLGFYKISEIAVEDPSEQKEEDIIIVDDIDIEEPTVEEDKTPVLTTLSFSQKLKTSPEFQIFQVQYTKATQTFREVFEEVLDGEADQESCNKALNALKPIYQGKTPLEILDMVNNIKVTDDQIFAHSLNVAVISRQLGKWLKMPKEELDALTIAGILHDIGKTQIPEEILNKPDKYTDEEFAMMQSHTTIGYKALKNMHVDMRIAASAKQHHERFDGSGYPDNLAADEIEPFAGIIAIADVYDAMTAPRSYRAPLCAFQVIAAFEREGFQKYNTKFLLTFLEHIASMYQNSRVMLSDSRCGRVVFLNKRSLSRPVIELDSGEIVDLSAKENREITITSIV